MFPLPILTWVKVGAAIAVLLGAYYLGYSGEHQRFLAFQSKVEAQGKIQEAKNQAFTQQAQSQIEGIHNDYQSQIANLNQQIQSDRDQYAANVRDIVGRMQHASSSSGTVPRTASAPARANAGTADDGLVELAQQCTATTAQLVGLQRYIRQLQASYGQATQ